MRLFVIQEGESHKALFTEVIDRESKMLCKIVAPKIRICFLTFSLTATTLASRALAQGTLQGRVVNGSQNGAPLVGQEVILHVMKHGEEVKGTAPQTKTHSQGDFQFANLDVDPHRRYYPSAVYQGIEYVGSPVAFTEKSTKALSNVIVYDTTASDQALREEMGHLIVDIGAGLLSVREIHLVFNSGMETYVGQEEVSPGKKKTLHFILPRNASSIELGSGLMSCCAVIQGENIYDTMELKPGMKQISYSYQLKYKGSKATLALAPTYNVGVLDLFIPESPAKVESPLFTPAGIFPMKDRSYRRYVAQNVSRGQAVEIRFSNLPPAPRDYRWLAIVGLGLVAIFATLFTLQKKGRREEAVLPAPGKENERAELEVKRQEYIAEIAQLDEQFEKGLLEEAAYQHRRQELKKELLKVTSALDGPIAQE